MLNYITQRQTASANMSGTPVIYLYNKFGILRTKSKLRELLNQGKIITRPGKNDTLIFLKEKL